MVCDVTAPVAAGFACGHSPARGSGWICEPTAVNSWHRPGAFLRWRALVQESDHARMGRGICQVGGFRAAAACHWRGSRAQGQGPSAVAGPLCSPRPGHAAAAPGPSMPERPFFAAAHVAPAANGASAPKVARSLCRRRRRDRGGLAARRRPPDGDQGAARPGLAGDLRGPTRPGASTGPPIDSVGPAASSARHGREAAASLL